MWQIEQDKIATTSLAMCIPNQSSRRQPEVSTCLLPMASVRLTHCKRALDRDLDFYTSCSRLAGGRTRNTIG